MYFWNVKKLNKDLVKGLDQKEDLKYLFAFLLMWMSVMFLPNEGINTYDTVSNILSVIIEIILVIFLYKINNSNSGENFLSRYMALSFVTIIRSLVFVFIPAIIITGIYLGVVHGKNIPEESGFEIIIFLLIYGLGYSYMNIKYWKELMKKIDKKSEK